MAVNQLKWMSPMSNPSLGDITDFEMCLELKPPERRQKVAEVKVKAVVDKVSTSVI